MPERSSVYVIDPYHAKVLSALENNDSIDLVLPDDQRKSEWPQKATAILVRSNTTISSDILEQAGSKLQFIIKQGVGVDNIDLEACSRKGIQVFNTPALNSETVAEMTMSLAFCIARRVCEVDRLIRDGERVVRNMTLGKSLHKKVVGIIGMGNIGLKVAKKWLGATEGSIIAFDPYATENAWQNAFPTESLDRVQDLDDLLRRSDVVTLHVPLTKSTTNLLSTPQFEIMKKGAILLNCARGGIVDESALLGALNSGHLFGAGLDAVQHEPPTRQKYAETLLSHPRVVITPHIGASTEENQERSGLAAVQILYDLLEGADSASQHTPLN